MKGTYNKFLSITKKKKCCQKIVLYVPMTVNITLPIIYKQLNIVVPFLVISFVTMTGAFLSTNTQSYMNQSLLMPSTSLLLLQMPINVLNLHKCTKCVSLHLRTHQLSRNGFTFFVSLQNNDQFFHIVEMLVLLMVTQNGTVSSKDIAFRTTDKCLVTKVDAKYQPGFAATVYAPMLTVFYMVFT